jgi:hypothetical protein
VVLSIDEKSQIQALDRTQPGLPLKPGRCATMTHDYLFAALNLLDGMVIRRCMQQQRIETLVEQLRDQQTPKGEGLACASSALDISFYADIRIMVERGRGLLLGADTQAHSPRQFSFGRRPTNRHQAILGRARCQA